MFVVLALCICAFAQAIRVMPLGDSITFGCGDSCATDGTADCSTSDVVDCPDPLGASTCHGGYRSILNKLLIENNYVVDFVGPLYNGNLSHAGYSGAAVGPESNGWSLAYLFDEWTQPQYKPDIILLHIGTNDVWAGKTGQTIAEELKALLIRTFNVWPDLRIILSSLLAMPTVGENEHWTEYNQAIPELVKELQSKNYLISFVDGAGLTGLCPSEQPNSLCCALDDVHLTAAGYSKFASVWYDALVPFLSK